MIPVILSAVAFIWLAVIMTDDIILVAAFAIMSVVAVAILRLAAGLAAFALRRLPESANPMVRRAIRGISGPDSNAPSVVVSIGMTLAMLVVVPSTVSRTAAQTSESGPKPPHAVHVRVPPTRPGVPL